LAVDEKEVLEEIPLSNQIPDNYVDALVWIIGKLEKRPWFKMMNETIDAPLPQDSEKVIKDNFENVPITSQNIFGNGNSQKFFKDFKFHLNRDLLLDDSNGFKPSLETCKRLAKLLVGTFYVEARFLYQELLIIAAQDEKLLFESTGHLKSNLPYSSAALAFFIDAKSKN